MMHQRMNQGQMNPMPAQMGSGNMQGGNPGMLGLGSPSQMPTQMPGMGTMQQMPPMQSQMPMSPMPEVPMGNQMGAPTGLREMLMRLQPSRPGSSPMNPGMMQGNSGMSQMQNPIMRRRM